MHAQKSSEEFLAHLVISSGGSRAILAGCGSIFACDMAGIKWQSIGGVSGGSIPAVLHASGLKPAALLQSALNVDFRELCSWTAGRFETVLALLLKEYYEHPHNRSAYGVMEIDKLGAFVDALVPTWPDKFWTMAVDGYSQILFNKDGIFEFSKKGRCTRLADKPARVGFAIQATCAIPGVTKPPKLGERLLFDGAFSKYGMCPVGVPIHHFGVDPSKVIGLCVGEDMSKGLAGLLRKAWKWLWAIKPDPSWGPHSAGVIDIHPHIDHIHALSFDLSADQKWLVVLQGFVSSIRKFALHGLLQGEALNKAQLLLKELPSLKRPVLAPLGQPQKLALHAENCFSRYQLI